MQFKTSNRRTLDSAHVPWSQIQNWIFERFSVTHTQMKIHVGVQVPTDFNMSYCILVCSTQTPHVYHSLQMPYAAYCPLKLKVELLLQGGIVLLFSANEFCLLPLLLSEWKNIKLGAENAIESVDKLCGSVQLIVLLLAMACVLLDC